MASLAGGGQGLEYCGNGRFFGGAKRAAADGGDG